MVMWAHYCLSFAVEMVERSLSLLLSSNEVEWYVLDSLCVYELGVDSEIEVHVEVSHSLW